MNIALILAGGTDPKVQMSVPKQFVNVFNRPVIVYTLESFQRHNDIDAIMVACLDGWQEISRTYALDAGITKLQKIVIGGENGQASARNALRELKKVCTGMMLLLYFSKVSAPNIKIMTMEDVEIFKALYRVEKEDWVK